MSAFALGSGDRLDRRGIEARVLEGLARTFWLALPLTFAVGSWMVLLQVLEGAHTSNEPGLVVQILRTLALALPAVLLATSGSARRFRPALLGRSRRIPPARRRHLDARRRRDGRRLRHLAPRAHVALRRLRPLLGRGALARCLSAARRDARPRRRPAARGGPHARRPSGVTARARRQERPRTRPDRGRRHRGPGARRPRHGRPRRQRCGRRARRLPGKRSAAALRRAGDRRQDHAQPLRRQRPVRARCTCSRAASAPCAHRRPRARSRRVCATTRSSRS